MLSDYQTLVTSLVRDDATKISTPQRDSAIALAVERYSKDRPRTKVEDVTGLTGQLIDLPPGYQIDFSEMQAIECPIGNVPPTELDSWGFYDAPSGRSLQFADTFAGATARFTYTVRHVLDGATDTIALGDREAVAKLAAAQLCQQLAAVYSNETDSTLAVDTARTADKASNYRRLGRDYRDHYNQHLGVQDQRAVAASAVANVGTPPGKRMADWLRTERMVT